MKKDIQNFIKRRWLCFIAALIICVCAGFGYAWSVMQNPIIKQFGWADSGVAVAYTITVLCSTMAPLLFGSFIRRISTRSCIILGGVLIGAGLFLTGTMTQIWQLYIFYGVIAGLGVGFVYPSLMAYVVKLFPEKTGFASGLGTAAYGSGAIIWAPVTVSMIEGSGIGGAFRLLGIVFGIVIFVCAFFLKTVPEGFGSGSGQTGKSNDTEEITAVLNLNRSQMVRTGSFYLMVIIFTCGLVSGVIIISQASPILQQTLNYTPAQAAVLVSVFSACNMAGRFLWGSLSDKLGLKKTAAFVFVICGASMALLVILKSEIPMIIAMGVVASCYGGLASVLTPLTASMFGPKYITENYGVMYVVFGLASLIGPNLATNFKVMANGSYTGAYITAAALCVLGLILSFFLKTKVSGKNT